MGRGVILPERSVVTSLPTPDRFADLFVARVGSQLMDDGPAPDAGAMGAEVEATKQFAGYRAVRRGRLGRKKLARQGGDLRGPVRVMSAAREPWLPLGRAALRAGFEIFAIQLIEARVSQAQLRRRLPGGQIAAAMTVQKMADKRCRQSFAQLSFFMAARVTPPLDFSLWN